LEEEIVEEARVFKDEGTEGVGEGEDDVKVRDGQDAVEGSLDPQFAFAALAFGTMAIATRVVGDGVSGFARWADVGMAAEFGSTASLKPEKHLTLSEGSDVRA
jgi:predicted Ser/Thr protein kinase